MGCDIHLHIEIKMNGLWRHYSMPHIERDYYLFGVMAGVRGDKDYMIVVPRGLPDDISAVTAFDYKRMECNVHTPSWLGMSDIDVLREILSSPYKNLERSVLGRTYLFGNSFEQKYLPYFIEDFRFVFWFDN